MVSLRESAVGRGIFKLFPSCSAQLTSFLRKDIIQFMELLLPLIWGISSFIVAARGNKEFCSHERIANFSEIIIERFMLGSIIKFDCAPDYDRISGSSGYFECRNDSGQIKWIHKGTVPLQCLDKRGESADKGNADDTYEAKEADGYDFPDDCGNKSIKNAKENIMRRKYPVGQEVRYMCQHGCKSSLQCSGTIKCIHVNGLTLWGDPGRECFTLEDRSPAPETTFSSALAPRIKFIAAASCSIVLVVTSILTAWIVRSKQRKKQPWRGGSSAEREQMASLA